MCFKVRVCIFWNYTDTVLSLVIQSDKALREKGVKI
jgi:hypothetical protein